MIYGYDVNKDNLKDAIQIKAIDKKLNKLDTEISECDVVFICTPVGKTKKILGKLNKILTKNKHNFGSLTEFECEILTTFNK